MSGFRKNLMGFGYEIAGRFHILGGADFEAELSLEGISCERLKSARAKIVANFEPIFYPSRDPTLISKSHFSELPYYFT